MGLAVSSCTDSQTWAAPGCVRPGPELQTDETETLNSEELCTALYYAVRPDYIYITTSHGLCSSHSHQPPRPPVRRHWALHLSGRRGQARLGEAQARPRRGPQRDSRGDWDGPVRREERGTRPASDWCAGSDELAELLGGWLAVGWPVCRPGQACHCTPRHGGPVLRGSSGLGPQHISGVRLHLHCGPAPAWDALRLQGLPGPRPAGGQQGLQEHAQHRGVLHLRQQLLRECTEGDQAPHA